MLEYEETIHTFNKKREATLPKGTIVQIPNWSRHRSVALWGKDADTFNPYRTFSTDESWGRAWAAFPTHSARFSPFSFPRRDCLGKNFAHMEMRIILLHLLKEHSFSLCGSPQTTGANHATLSPRMTDYENTTKSLNLPELGCMFRVTPVSSSKL